MLSVRLSNPGQRLRTVRQLAGKKPHAVRQTLLAVAVTALCVSGPSVATHAARYSSSPAHTAAARPAPPPWFRGNPCTYRSQLWRMNTRLAKLITEFVSLKDRFPLYQVLVSDRTGLGHVLKVANAHRVPVSMANFPDAARMKPVHSDIYTRATQTIFDGMIALATAAAEADNSDPTIHQKYPGDYHLAVADNAKAWRLLKRLTCAP